MKRSHALNVIAGTQAAKHLEQQGWRGNDIQMMLGASGGPKWLILGHLDRALFSDFLLKERSSPLQVLGSSIGAWRHACLALDNPSSAINRFEEAYFHQRYSESPDAREISAASKAMMAHILGSNGAQHIIDNPQVHSHIVTARGWGMRASQNQLKLLLGMAGAGALNAVSRGLLNHAFQRVVFTSQSARGADNAGFEYRDFNTQEVPLSAATFPLALHASGSIPFVLTGESAIDGAPSGHYWDGGILDYHFASKDIERFGGGSGGLLLYPHFRADITPGWFDKFLPWRRQTLSGLNNLLLISPSKRFVASLPHKKIPDRGDFKAMTYEERLTYWRVCIDRSRELADDFRALCEANNPLEGVEVLAS